MALLRLNGSLVNPFLVCLSLLYSTWASYLDPDNLENLKSLKSPPYKLSRFKLIPEKRYEDHA